jgi:integrase
MCTLIDLQAHKLMVREPKAKEAKEGKEKPKAAPEVAKLTAPAVEKYRLKSKRRRIRDSGCQSLFLIIEPSGHRSWQMRFRRASDGKPGKITLGPVQDGEEAKGAPAPVIGMPLTLAGARQLATAVLRERAAGGDPVADHKARKHRLRSEVQERDASSFAACARRYVDEHLKRNTRNWREAARQLGLDFPLDGGEAKETKGGLLQRWADKPVRTIDGHDIWNVTDEARRIGVPGIDARNPGHSEPRARGFFVVLSSFFTWCARNRLVDVNPCRTVPRPAPAVVRDRVLSQDEIRWFWKACDSADAPRVPGAPKPFAVLLKLLLLTGQRLDEVAGMTREELHDDGTWHLAGTRTKNKKAHVVPLPPLARDLIATMPGESGFLFTTTGTSPVSGWSRTKKRLDAAMLALAREERGPKATIPPWRLHDVRRVAVTGMVELGVPPHVVELVVNHVSGHKAGVAGVYNKSEMLPERKAALERWAKHIAGLVAGKPTNVVRLSKSRRAP